jgi:bacterioferritin (cytochrome b1)
MVTTVGTEGDVRTLVTDFIQLEHDAIAAYETCIERLDASHRRERIAEFLSDHERHLRELHDIARRVGADIPDESGMKSMLTTGKVALADMMGGDGAILKAMSTNETDTVTAYERGMRHADLDVESRSVFERAHSDEMRHKSWMEAEARAA